VVEELTQDESAATRSTCDRGGNTESMARSEFEAYIDALGPYEFQDLVAALL
jgi:hypothetical protein